VGGRIRREISAGKELSLEGDVGGFGAGSEFSWQVVAAYGYDTMFLGMPLHAVLGYRALSVDFSETGAMARTALMPCCMGLCSERPFAGNDLAAADV
jgi:hypothetical protein